MKILLLSDRIPPEGKGGAEAVVWALARGLAEQGREVHIVTTTGGATFQEARAGMPTYHLHSRYPERFRAWLTLWNPQTVGAFRDVLARLQPDVVNAHNIHNQLSYHTLKLARDAGCAVVYSAHDAMSFAYGKLSHYVRADASAISLPAEYRLPRAYNLRQNRFRYNPLRNPLIKRYLRQCAHIRTAPSQALAAAWRANGMPAVEALPNGIDPAAWQPPDKAAIAALRQQLGLEDAAVILFVGRLTRAKGSLQALQALAQVRERLPQARLLVLTARDFDKQIPAEYAHLRPAIRSGGWLTGADLRAAYHLADVVTVPSIYLDPFPTVNLEAMAAGKALVSTCFGGSPEAVIDGETGYIVNPFDIGQFADRLLRLLTNEALRCKMGLRGRERLEREFTLGTYLSRMNSIYARALSL